VAPHTARAWLLSTTCYSMQCCHIENSSTLMDYFVHTEDTQCIIGRMYIVRIMVNSCTSLSHFHSKHTPRECYGKENWSTTEPLWDKTQGSVSHFQWSTEYPARSRLLISRLQHMVASFQVKLPNDGSGQAKGINSNRTMACVYNTCTQVMPRESSKLQ